MHGYSRDLKPSNRQVVVGVAMVNGLPIAHHVFQGKTKDAKTLEQVVRDLEERFGVRRIVFVGDGGMVTAQNLKFLKSQGRSDGYLVGLNHRRDEQIYRYMVESATGAWQSCVNLKRQEAIEGKYIIVTEEKNLIAVEAVQYYKGL